jgi:hypothetical protein
LNGTERDSTANPAFGLELKCKAETGGDGRSGERISSPSKDISIYSTQQ